MARVYVVDDDAELVELMLYVLQHDGYQASGYTRPHEACEAIAALQPDLVLVDLLMPEMNGTELSGKLRANAATKDVPIAFLSGHCHLEKEACGVGVDAFLAKPFSPDELLAFVAARLAIL